VFDTSYKESDKQQNTSIEHATPTYWDILHVSNEAGSEFAECCWWAANALVFYSDSIARVAINPP
jgi:hypothetical protein